MGDGGVGAGEVFWACANEPDIARRIATRVGATFIGRKWDRKAYDA